MDWLRLAEFLKLKMLPMQRESCADFVESVVFWPLVFRKALLLP